MEQGKKNLLVKSVIIGGVAGSVVLAVKSKSKLNSCFNKCYQSTTGFAKFINENRGEIIAQLKLTSDKVTKVIDASNHDLKAILENVKHLKSSSAQMIGSVLETKEQLLSLLENCKQESNCKNNQNLQG